MLNRFSLVALRTPRVVPVRRFSTSSIVKRSLSWTVAAATATVFCVWTYTAGQPADQKVRNEAKPLPNGLEDALISKYGGPEAVAKAIPRFEAIVGSDCVSVDEQDRLSHSHFDGSTYNSGISPNVVVRPHSTEEVSEIAKVCHELRLPMIGYSGGTSLEGHISAMDTGVVSVDFMHMDKIFTIRQDDLDVTVQPAVGWMDLNVELEPYGLFFAVDPGPTAKIGGMVSNNCSGTNCVRYGPMRNHVINLTVVLADGTIVKTKRRPRKSSAGYNLNHLFCGSEGTLGLITEITLRLEVLPEIIRVATCSFPSVHDATETAARIIRSGIQVHAIELMDDVQMWAINKSGLLPNKTWNEQATLFFKFSGSAHTVEENISRARTIAQKVGGSDFEFAQTEEESHEIWTARKELLWTMMGVAPPGAKMYSTDVAVPLSRLADLVMATKQDLKETGILASCLGHVGDGNFHCSIMYLPEELEKLEPVIRRMIERALEMEGTCTGEHGIGVGKMLLLGQELEPAALEAMWAVKKALDPLELMNPGKVVSPESIAYSREFHA